MPIVLSVRALLVALACGVPLACAAKRFDAVVSHVTDGDTVWVRPVTGGPPQHVRIDGIDAPEICQAFGTQAREALSGRVMHKRVTLTTRGADDYRRTIARIRLGREDVGAWMVTQGYAWSYRFRRDRGAYAREESHARERHVGLWGSRADSPRDFRVRHGPCV